MTDVWDLVHAERLALIDDLGSLDDAGWSTPSLCGGWSVREVAAHLVDNARTTLVRLVMAMARAGFDFDRQNADGVARELGATPGHTLAGLRIVAARRTGPPVSLDSRLVEEVVHGEDIRRPLGLTRPYPPEAVRRALHYQARTSVGMGGGRERIAGVRLRATDADMVLGEGPEVNGPILSLLLVVSGREAFRSELAGPGVASLG